MTCNPSKYHQMLADAMGASVIYSCNYKGGTVYAMFHNPQKHLSTLIKALADLDHNLQTHAPNVPGRTIFMSISSIEPCKVLTFSKKDKASHDEYYRAIFNHEEPGTSIGRKHQLNPGVYKYPEDPLPEQAYQQEEQDLQEQERVIQENPDDFNCDEQPDASDDEPASASTSRGKRFAGAGDMWPQPKRLCAEKGQPHIDQVSNLYEARLDDKVMIGELKCKQLKGELKCSKRKNSKLKAKNQKLRTQLREVPAAVDNSAVQKAEVLQGHVESLTAQLNDKHKELAAKEEEHSRTLQAKDAQVNELTNTLEAKERDLQTAIDQNTIELSEKDGERKHLAAKAAELQNALQAKNSECQARLLAKETEHTLALKAKTDEFQARLLAKDTEHTLALKAETDEHKETLLALTAEHEHEFASKDRLYKENMDALHLKHRESTQLILQELRELQHNNPSSIPSMTDADLEKVVANQRKRLREQENAHLEEIHDLEGKMLWDFNSLYKELQIRRSELLNHQLAYPQNNSAHFQIQVLRSQLDAHDEAVFADKENKNDSRNTFAFTYVGEVGIDWPRCIKINAGIIASLDQLTTKDVHTCLLSTTKKQPPSKIQQILHSIRTIASASPIHLGPLIRKADDPRHQRIVNDIGNEAGSESHVRYTAEPSGII